MPNKPIPDLSSCTMFNMMYYLSCLFIRYSGLATADRMLSRDKITIVMYHNPDPVTFEKHVRYLVKKYHPVSFSDLSELLRQEHHTVIPANPLLITIDDGWKENYGLLPVIRKYNIRPLLFLTAQLIDTERGFWWTQCPPGEVEYLKRLPTLEARAWLRDKYGHEPEKEYPGERQVLNMQEINEMKPYVDFGLHSSFHPVLTTCTREEKREEIMQGKLLLEQMLGTEIRAFSYPNGNYDDECIHLLIEAGIEVARTTDAGRNHRASDPYRLKITGVSDTGSVSKLVAELTGIPLFLQYLFFHRSLDGKKKNISF